MLVNIVWSGTVVHFVSIVRRLLGLTRIYTSEEGSIYPLIELRESAMRIVYGAPFMQRELSCRVTLLSEDSTHVVLEPSVLAACNRISHSELTGNSRMYVVDINGVLSFRIGE